MPSYTYTPNVPNAPQLISDTQPTILQNFQSIGSIIGQDHVGFNAANGGTHTVVNLNNQASDPATVAAGFLALYTKQVAGVQELFVERPGSPGSIVQITGAGGSIVNPGSYTLPGGLILKWGIVGPITYNSTFSFPVAFPNNCFNIQLTFQSHTTGTSFSAGLRSDVIDRGSFYATTTIKGYIYSAAYYFAIGN